ncbi:MAG: cytochrome c [Bacteroidota bacterium]
MKKGMILATLLILGLALSCQWENEPAGSTAPILDQSIQEKGFQVLQQQCVSCHSPNPSAEKPIAPTLATIKTAYLAQATEEPAFTALIQQFLAKPSAQNSLIDGAIEQYGVMPIMNLSTEEVKALASYIYHTPVETVAWYEQEYPQALAGFM